nr:MAG TPA: hypothetical protein [Caudoviricetes sp.]
MRPLRPGQAMASTLPSETARSRRCRTSRSRRNGRRPLPGTPPARSVDNRFTE